MAKLHCAWCWRLPRTRAVNGFRDVYTTGFTHTETNSGPVKIAAALCSLTQEAIDECGQEWHWHL
ncbi:hypothetical protein GN244_ATG10042 [Phytophthora infestans]|uniref:Uncharacterized protein n=1 Tax=Phytophthora infestans TaxID=4787 RepID=A0A833T5R6_PHYIN|nr:hypothetical protein GN244_ATG10042 [Phytophthora infestans]